MAADADSYWHVLKVEAAKVTGRGENPVLLLDNATRPDWIWDSPHADYGADYNRPENLRMQRLEGHGKSHVRN